MMLTTPNKNKPIKLTNDVNWNITKGIKLNQFKR